MSIAEKPVEASPRWAESATTVYVGGPIDLAMGDPDERHRSVAVALATRDFPAAVYCPLCRSRREGPEDPADLHARNMKHLLGADIVVFEWNIKEQPSLGSPIEVWERTGAGRSAIIIGPMPAASVYANLLSGRGVSWFDSIGEWADQLVGIARDTEIRKAP